MTSGFLILVIAVLILPLTICSSSIYTIGANSCLHEDIAYKPQPRHLNYCEQMRSTFGIDFDEPSDKRSIHSPTVKKKKKVTFDDNVVIRRMQQRRQADNRDTTKLDQTETFTLNQLIMNVQHQGQQDLRRFLK